jgi:hypothetical protein
VECLLDPSDFDAITELLKRNPRDLDLCEAELAADQDDPPGGG